MSVMERLKQFRFVPFLTISWTDEKSLLFQNPQKNKTMIITLCQPLLDYRIADFDDIISLFELNNDDYMRITTEKTLNMFSSKQKIMTSLGGSSLNTFLKIKECTDIDLKFFGAIGDDKEGEDLCGLMTKSGVDFYFEKIAARGTGRCFIGLKRSKRILCTWLDASELMEPFFIEKNKNIVEQARIAYLSTFIISFNINTVHSFLKYLNDSVTLVINLGSEKLYSDDNMMFIQMLLKNAKVIIGNKSEANALIEKTLGGSVSTERGMAEISRKGTLFICTNGPESVKYAFNGEIHEVEVSKGRQVFQDTCGAGDAFAAGVLVGLYNNQATGECVKLGVEYALTTLEKNDKKLKKIMECTEG
ncbi:putative pfkB family carbohydrate kinase [Trachipleistophora hominis]|uniref:Adenosine kinase n=1 Tax=Trachipleistophora hominis TaxID=72359 RepID=L7K050_TRAHO|nr:putative pfkB family carbohydrate kinase [Trachipleistophora hominis]